VKVEVYTREGVWERQKPKCIWRGELPAIPRVGDYVVVRDGCGSEPVFGVHWDLETGLVEIILETTDHENVYPEVEIPTDG
jgi:hypothetical protein